MVITEVMKGVHNRQSGLFMLIAIGLVVVSGCSTDVVPVAPDPESRDLPTGENVSEERLLTVYSRDFKTVYDSSGSWTDHMLVYLSIRFLAQDGLTAFRNLSQEKKKTYPGIQTFATKLKEEGGAWKYAALHSLDTLRQANMRESFRSQLNFVPFQYLAIGKWLKSRLMSDQPLPDFDVNETENEFIQPIKKAMALALTAQYYLRSYQSVTEPTVLEAYYNRDMTWLINQWKTNYLRVRSIWKPKFDLTVLSTHSLRPLYTPAEQRPAEEFWNINPAERNYGRSTLPFNEVHDIPISEVPSRIRDLQTKAIQEFIERRFHASLRRWLQCLTYALKYRFYEELSGEEFPDRSNINFYARNALQDIDNVIKMN